MDSVSTTVPSNNAVDELSNGPAKNVAADTQNGLTALSKILGIIIKTDMYNVIYITMLQLWF